MSVYCFVGQKATKEGVFSLEVFGQHVELSDEAAHEAILDGVALMPEQDFDALFSEADLKYVRDNGLHDPTSHRDDVISREFLEKKREAWRRVHAHREAMKENSLA